MRRRERGTDDYRQRPERRAAILAAIATYQRLHHYPPTRRELADMTGMQTAGHIGHHLNILRAAGMVTWQDGKARTLRIVEREDAR